MISVVRSGQVTASRLGMTLPQFVMTQTPGREITSTKSWPAPPRPDSPPSSYKGGLMNFDLDLKHTQWQPICKK